MIHEMFPSNSVLTYSMRVEGEGFSFTFLIQVTSLVVIVDTDVVMMLPPMYYADILCYLYIYICISLYLESDPRMVKDFG